jgi:hypothetical protein
MSAVTDIQTIINDQGVFWPVQNIWDAINEAQFAVYAETKWAITTQTFSLTSNADIVPIPSNILIPKWIEGTNSLFQPAVVKRFFPTTMRNLEHFLRTWRGNNLGQPEYFVQWDATHWRVFPRPDGSGSGPGGVYPFKCFGVGFPPEIVDSTSTLLGDATYRYAVYNYTASLLLEATRPDLADLYLAQAQDNILTMKKRLRNQQSHNLRTLKPATSRLEIQQGGQISELPSYYPLES